MKSFKRSKGRITRYYSTSISSEYFSIIGYLKNKTTREIICLLYCYKEKNFTEIRSHIGRASSTTSWNISRLSNDYIIDKIKTNRGYTFVLVQPKLSNVLESFENLLLDRTFDRRDYGSRTDLIQ